MDGPVNFFAACEGRLKKQAQKRLARARARTVHFRVENTLSTRFPAGGTLAYFAAGFHRRATWGNTTRTSFDLGCFAGIRSGRTSSASTRWLGWARLVRCAEDSSDGPDEVFRERERSR